MYTLSCTHTHTYSNNKNTMKYYFMLTKRAIFFKKPAWILSMVAQTCNFVTWEGRQRQDCWKFKVSMGNMNSRPYSKTLCL